VIVTVPVTTIARSMDAAPAFAEDPSLAIPGATASARELVPDSRDPFDPLEAPDPLEALNPAAEHPVRDSEAASRTAPRAAREFFMPTTVGKSPAAHSPTFCSFRTSAATRRSLDGRCLQASRTPSDRSLGLPSFGDGSYREPGLEAAPITDLDITRVDCSRHGGAPARNIPDGGGGVLSGYHHVGAL